MRLLSTLILCLSLASLATAGTYEVVNRIDSDPLVDSVGGQTNIQSNIFNSRLPATYVRSLPHAGQAKEARFLVVGATGIEAPVAELTTVEEFQQLLDFEFHLWTEGAFGFGDTLSEFSGFEFPLDSAHITLDLPDAGDPGFAFEKLSSDIPGRQGFEVTVDLSGLQLDLVEGQDFAFSLVADRKDASVGGWLFTKVIQYPGPPDTYSITYSTDWLGVITAPEIENNNVATVFSIQVDGPDIPSVSGERAIYTGIDGVFDDPLNWDLGVVPDDNGFNYNAVIPQNSGTVTLGGSPISLTKFSVGHDTTFEVSGGATLEVTDQAVITGSLRADGIGTNVQLVGPGTAVDAGGSVEVTGGATVQIATRRFHGLRYFNDRPYFSASGQGSELDLSTLQHITGESITPNQEPLIQATDGAVLDLSGLESIEWHDQTGFGTATGLLLNARSGGRILLDGLQEIRGGQYKDPDGVTISLDDTEGGAPSLTVAEGLVVAAANGSTFTLGPTAENESLTLTRSGISVSGASIVNANRLKDIPFTTIEIVGNSSQLSNTGFVDIDGSRFLVRDGGNFTIEADASISSRELSYNGVFEAGFNSYGEQGPIFLASGVGSVLNGSAISEINLDLGTAGLFGTGVFGEISAIGGGQIDLRGLRSLEAKPTGGAFDQDPAALFVNIDGGGVLQLSAPSLSAAIVGSAVKVNVAGNGSKITAETLIFHDGNYPMANDAAALRKGSSLRLVEGGALQISQDFRLRHTEIGDLVSTELTEFRDQSTSTSSPVTLVAGGVDLNQGVVEFVGTEESTMEVAGGEFLGFGEDGRPLLPAGRAEFGIAQLVVGTSTDPKTLRLANNIDNSIYDGTVREALYLWGFGDGLPDFSAEAIGSGVGPSLVIHPGSTLLIPESIDVVYYDDVAESFVHVNSLFGTGFGEIAFDGGTIALTPNLPGDYNGDGTVNAADYTVWRDNFGATGSDPYDLGDGDGDGDTDGADYLVWQRQFGMTTGDLASSSTASLTVPEPTSVSLLLLGFAEFASLRLGRRKELAAV